MWTIEVPYLGVEYENLVLLARADGTRLHLGDVATVVDGFAGTDQSARFDLTPAVLVPVPTLHLVVEDVRWLLGLGSAAGRRT